MNLDKSNTNQKLKSKHFETFVKLIKNQFEHGGEKYKLGEEKEFTDGICECFPGETGIDWVLGTCMKYLGRYKNFGREKDLLKVANYMFIIWLKGGHYKKEKHDEDVLK